MKVGDYIYGCETDFRTHKVHVNRVTVTGITAKTLKTEKNAGGWGLGYRSTHKRDEVYTSAEQALRAYLIRIKRTLLNAHQTVDETNATFVSVNEQLAAIEAGA